MERRATDRRRAGNQSSLSSNLSDIISVLYKHCIVFLFITFVPVIFCLFLLPMSSKEYKASSSIILEDQQLNITEYQDIFSTTKFDNMTVPTQISVIRSPALIQETIHVLEKFPDFKNYFNLFYKNKLELKNNESESVDYSTFKVFQQNLDVKQQGTSRVIEVSFLSKDPNFSAAAVNTHIQQYVLSRINYKKSQAKKIRDWIAEQILNLKSQNANKMEAVQNFRVESGMALGRDTQELVYQQISDIALQLTPTETKVLELKARNELLSKGDIESISEVVDSKLIQTLKSRLSDVTQKLESLRTNYGDNHPSVVSIQQEVKQIRKDIQNEIIHIRKSIKNELETLIKQKEMIELKLAELQKQANSFQEKQGKLQTLQLEETASKKMLDNFLSRSEQINSQLDFTRPDVQVISIADVPVEPINSKRPLILLCIFLLSIGLGLFVIFLVEQIDSGVQSKEDVQRFLNVKLLGALPFEPFPIQKTLNKERIKYLEEIKRIYMNLNANKPMKTILFSSAKKEEGKSTVVISLAYYLNSIGNRILVVDADTRNPSLASLTKIKNENGLNELLAGTKTLQEVLIKDDYGVTVLPAGKYAENISDFLLEGKFKPYLSILEKTFDYILIDSASVFEATDAEVLSPLVDQVILVSSWSKTPRKKIKQTVEVIRMSSQNAPCIILNKVNSKI